MPKYIGQVVARFAPGESFYYMNNGRPVEAVVDKVIAKFSDDTEEVFLMVASDGPLGIGAMIKDNHAFRTEQHAIDFTTLGITPKEYELDDAKFNDEYAGLKAMMDVLSGPTANHQIFIPKGPNGDGETIQVTINQQPQETDAEKADREIIEEVFSKKASEVIQEQIKETGIGEHEAEAAGRSAILAAVAQKEDAQWTGEKPWDSLADVQQRTGGALIFGPSQTMEEGKELYSEIKTSAAPTAPEEIPAGPGPEPEPVKKSRRKSSGKEDTLK